MSRRPTLADTIRHGDPIPFPLASALSAASVFVRFGMALRLKRPSKKVDAHVVSFGNITAGGTGKTPAVIERAQRELDQGKKVGILTRGYGSASGSNITVWTQPPSPEERSLLGDEPSLIIRKAPGVIVFKGRNRVDAARKAVNEHACNVLLLDDGFQHTMLARDENILLIDASNPFGNGHILPRGILREPLVAMNRATEIILTRCDQADDLKDLLATINRHAPNTPIRKTVHRPTGLRRLSDNWILPIEELQDMEIAAACAIGNPEAFFTTLENLGARITQRSAHRDHAKIPPETFAGTHPVVITEKDAMRIDKPKVNIFALEIELRDQQT